MITMIGLAVGIDYSLFIVSRFREERTRGVSVEESIATAGATATRAVFFSGVTVILALAGLLIMPMNIFISFGLGTITVVIVAVLAGLTLLPAVLSIMGDNVNRLSIWIPGLRKHCEGAKCQEEGHDDDHFNYWDRFSRAVMRVPVLSMLLAVGILVAASVSYFDINTGTSGVTTVPDQFRGKQGFLALQEEFGFGGNNPAEVVIVGDNLGSEQVQQALGALNTSLAADKAFAPAPPLQVSSDNGSAVLSVPVVGDVTSEGTVSAVRRLRTEYIRPPLATCRWRSWSAGRLPV